MVDSCSECHYCKNQEEQLCEKGFTATYSAYEKGKQTSTLGGYSTQVNISLSIHRTDSLP